MNIQSIQRSYQSLLIQTGIEEHRAESVAQNLSPDEFRMISEIWPEWEQLYSSDCTV